MLRLTAASYFRRLRAHRGRPDLTDADLASMCGRCSVEARLSAAQVIAEDGRVTYQCQGCGHTLFVVSRIPGESASVGLLAAPDSATWVVPLPQQAA
jgi:hypothetical protein